MFVHFFLYFFKLLAILLIKDVVSLHLEVIPFEHILCFVYLFQNKIFFICFCTFDPPKPITSSYPLASPKNGSIFSLSAYYICFSKLLVSRMFLTLGTTGAVIFLTFSQSNPLKKGCYYISFTPFTPSLVAGFGSISFLIKSSASGDTSSSP